jgi:hypothetical protein
LVLNLEESSTGLNSLADVRQQKEPCHDAQRSRVNIIKLQTQTDDAA